MLSNFDYKDIKTMNQYFHEYKLNNTIKAQRCTLYYLEQLLVSSIMYGKNPDNF